MGKPAQRRSSREPERRTAGRSAAAALLYDELLKIGRIEKTIRPDALHGYPRLLRCAAVRQRAGDVTDESVLARHASDALRDSIESLVDPQRRLIAEAALAIRPPFEGQRIDERIRDLSYLSDDQFKYGRKLALERIAERLEQSAHGARQVPSRNAEPSHRIENPPTHDSPLVAKRKRAFNALGHGRAVALHYAAIGALFSIRFTLAAQPAITRTVRNSSGAVINVYTDVAPSLAEYLFGAYYDFLSSTSLDRIASTDFRTADEARKDVICRLYSALLERDPLAQNLERCGDGVDWHFRERRQVGSAIFLSRSAAFARYWRPWYDRSFGDAHADINSTLEAIAGASGGYAVIAAEAFGPDHVPYVEAKAVAKEELLTYFSHDAIELSPTIDDHLAQYLDVHLPREGDELTNTTLREIISAIKEGSSEV